MIEEAVLALQVVQIVGHLVGGMVQVFLLAGSAVSLGLYDGYHVHIINPHTGLPGEALVSPALLRDTGVLRALPLSISVRQSQVQVLLILGDTVKEQRQATEHVNVNMVHNGQILLLRAEEVSEATLKQAKQTSVASSLGEKE